MSDFITIERDPNRTIPIRRSLSEEQRERAERIRRKILRDRAEQIIAAGGLLPEERAEYLQQGLDLIERGNIAAKDALSRYAAATGEGAVVGNPYLIAALRHKQALQNSLDEYALQRKQDLMRRMFAEESQAELDEIAGEEEERRRRASLLGGLFKTIGRTAIGFLTGGPSGAAAGAVSGLL